MTAATTLLGNPYWDAVKDHIGPDRFYGTPCVDWGTKRIDRHELTSRYAWTISSPATVAFIAEHSGARVVDPMAGTGYWAGLLRQTGVDVAAYDLNPPGTTDNSFHREGATFVDVYQGAAADTVTLHPDATLLLSWPPYGFDATPILRAFAGDRIIYIGEGYGGCCGDDDLFELLGKEWAETAEHDPIQWWGIHDTVTVYDRSTP